MTTQLIGVAAELFQPRIFLREAALERAELCGDRITDFLCNQEACANRFVRRRGSQFGESFLALGERIAEFVEISRAGSA